MGEEKLRQLRALGVEPPMKLPEEYIDHLRSFLEGFDFMKLGQAVNRKRWESAMMTIRRMERRSDELGLVCFQRGFAGIRQAVVRKDALLAKQLLAAVIQKRVKLLKELRDA